VLVARIVKTLRRWETSRWETIVHRNFGVTFLWTPLAHVERKVEGGG
jgi:hypothetical protein